MGALQKMSGFLGWSEEPEDAYEDEFEQADANYAPQEPENFVDGDFQEALPVEVAPQGGAPDLRRIKTVHPTTYNDAVSIGESFRDGVPVIIDLTAMSDADARRMVDFASGLIFGLRGSLERVTGRVFLLTPAHVEIDGAEVSQSRGQLFNQS